MVILASTRATVAEYIETVIYVYIVIIFIYVLLQLLFSVGLRIPYARWTDVVLTFLRDVCEPFLRLFRRFARFGPVDLSPIFAIIVLGLINTIVVRGIIRG
jgi:YggT family protein